MPNHIYLDHNALKYAFEAGGLALLDEYVSYATQQGFNVVVTDVVFNEIFEGPLANDFTSETGWFADRGVQSIATQV